MTSQPKSVHNGGKSNNYKYATAVYSIEVDNLRGVTDDWVPFIEQLIYPEGYGKWVSAGDLTCANGRTRWLMLITNTKQTTKDDLVGRLENLGCTNIEVRVKMAVPYHGQSTNVGSTRTGTKRVHKSLSHDIGLVAR